MGWHWGPNDAHGILEAPKNQCLHDQGKGNLLPRTGEQHNHEGFKYKNPDLKVVSEELKNLTKEEQDDEISSYCDDN